MIKEFFIKILKKSPDILDAINSFNPDISSKIAIKTVLCITKISGLTPNDLLSSDDFCKITKKCIIKTCTNLLEKAKSFGGNEEEVLLYEKIISAQANSSENIALNGYLSSIYFFKKETFFVEQELINQLEFAIKRTDISINELKDLDDSIFENIIRKALIIFANAAIEKQQKVFNRNALQSLSDINKRLSSIEEAAKYCLSIDQVLKSSDLINDYYPDDKRESIIDALKNLLNISNLDNKAMHIRVLGASGIGKTKTVIEALNDDRIKSKCLFFEFPERFDSFDGYNSLDKNSSVILVIDECDSRSAERIFNKLEYNFPYVKLITIYNDCRIDNAPKNHFIVEELTDEALSKAIKSVSDSFPPELISQIIKLCEGFPRVAIRVAENLTISPEKYLANLDNIWLKYISDEQSLGSIDTQNRMQLLEYFSLFERFGYQCSYKQQFDFIKSIIQKRTSISEDTLRKYIAQLKEKKILRGNNILYISPRIFHNWLKKQWWAKNSADFKYEDFTSGMPTDLVQFFDKEIYDSDLSVKKNLIDKQFNSLEDIERKPQLFWCSLYQNEEYAFDKLEYIIEDTPDEQLETPRSSVRELLMHFAREESFFERSSDLLFRIACNEGKTYYSNDTKAVFSELFSIIYNDEKVSHTFTPLEKKVTYLELLLKEYKNDKELEIILNAITIGVTDPTRLNRWESHGRNITIYSVNAINLTGVQYEYISKLLNLTMGILNKIQDEKLLEKCVQILISSPFYLLQENDSFEFALGHYKNLLTEKKFDVIKLMDEIEDGLRYNWFKRLSQENKIKLEEFYISLKQENKINEFQMLCGKHFLEEEQEARLVKLLEENAIEEQGNLEFLFSDKSKLSYLVGEKLALKKKDSTELCKLIEKYIGLNKPKNIEIILGYFLGLYNTSPDETEKMILEINKDNPLFEILPRIIRVVETENTAKLLFAYIKEGVFDISQFTLFGKTCSKDTLEEIISYVLTKLDENDALEDIITNMIFYNKSRIRFGQNLVINCMSKMSRITSSKHHRDSYVWSEIAKEYIDNNLSAETLCNIFKNLLENEDSFDQYIKNILCTIAGVYPKESWVTLSSMLKDKKSLLFLSFEMSKHWLENGLLSIFEKKDIIEWIDEDMEDRLYIISHMAPEHFLPSKDNPDNAFYHDLLIKYPNSSELSKGLSGRSFSGSHWGPESEFLKDRIVAIEKMLKSEEENVVKKWLRNELKYHKGRLERAIEREEGSDF